MDYSIDTRKPHAPHTLDQRRKAWREFQSNIHRVQAILQHFTPTSNQACIVAAWLDQFLEAFDEPPAEPYITVRPMDPVEIEEMYAEFAREVAPLWPLFHAERLG